MARYIPIGAPINRSEAEGLRQLRDQLPSNYIVIGNFELQLPRRRNTLEFDVVVVGDWGIWAVEIKGWTGEITGDIRRWNLRWGRVESPFIRVESKAKALRDLLARSVTGWPGDLYCEAVVHLPTRQRPVDIDDPRIRRLILRDGVHEYFVEHASTPIEETPDVIHIDDALKERIVDALVPLAAPQSTLPIVPNYDIDEELEQRGLPYREFVGSHTLLRSRGRVRIKGYSMDPLIEPRDRDAEIARVLKDMEILNTMETTPYVTRAYELIRDMDDELIFYVVTEWVGRRTLADLFAQDRPLYRDADADERQRRWRLAHHLVTAVAEIHKHGIVHCNLQPEVIYLDEASGARVPLKIADFDFAIVGDRATGADALMKVIKSGYSAPEMWHQHEADHRVDVYAVGAILFELLVGAPLYAPQMESFRHREVIETRRQDLPDEECQRLCTLFLAYSPDARLDDLTQCIPFFEERAARARV